MVYAIKRFIFDAIGPAAVVLQMSVAFYIWLS